MKSHEFIKAALTQLIDKLDDVVGQEAEQSVELSPVEPEYKDNTEQGGVFVAPLQAKLELLKKAVDVDSIYDQGGQDNDLTGHGADNEDDLDQLKKLSGINIVVADEAASDEPLDV